MPSPALWLQYLLPHRLLSGIVRGATRCTFAPWKNFLIATVVKKYAVDLREAAQPQARAYASFNAFFTRALREGARPPPADPRALACPADGRISQCGDIRAGRLFQAKGMDFTAAELLGEASAASIYAEGRFATIYLSPRDYHRVHMPLAGTLRETAHIPGRLFSVAPFTVEAVPRLFARNERLVCHFAGDDGLPFCIVLVGAMLVSAIDTIWGGPEIPPYANGIVRKDWRDKNIRLERSAEMARFGMGSTVIVLLPAARAMRLACAAGEAVRVGNALSH